MTMKCNNHKQYQAKHRPQVECLDCWCMWLDEGHEPRASDLLEIIKLIRRDIDLAMDGARDAGNAAATATHVKMYGGFLR